MKPVRIQRSRQHKMVSPNGLPIVYVGRPSKWGNPYQWYKCGKEEATRIFGDELEAGDMGVKITIKEIKEELKGKNLACWCKLSEKCHGDILLKIANE